VKESEVSLGRILVIDDEAQMHRFLKPALEAAGYEMERADTAAQGLRLAGGRAPDAILLDLGLPDMDGQEVLQRLRAFSEVPVLVLSARDREAEKIAALDGGADDYLEKPFSVGELLARLRACLRRRLAQQGSPPVYSVGPLSVDLLKHEVRIEGAPVALSRREFDLLAMLARSPGRVMTHRHLLVGVWGPAHVEDVQYLRVYIGQLRQKLGAASDLIMTEPGIGYRLKEGS
jgi:two-component system, OmpR family, KDP operon response regulator KdpE